jgi:UDP-3-O-[3-hydroxymyristoyl] glucosamine N-acyltransferase
MADVRFFTRSAPQTIQALASLSGAMLADECHADYLIVDVAPLDRAGESEVSFLDNPKYVELFRTSRAGACIVKPKYAGDAPAAMRLLLSDDPYRAYARIAQYFYPYIPLEEGISPNAHIDASAHIGEGCAIAAGVVIGKHVMVGKGCTIGANSVIHDGVTIGDNTRIGALCSISHAQIGERVIIHRGVHIGQDGFGFALAREGHVKVPQLGRVMIGDEVEIGAGTCIDRGTGPDTVIGEGTKIDNLVQIGHNVVIGKHAVIVSQVGIAGSTRIGDGAVLGGQVGLAGHIRIGAGARLAAQSGVIADVPAGASYGGTPAVPIKDWHRQTVTLARLIKPKHHTHFEAVEEAPV